MDNSRVRKRLLIAFVAIFAAATLVSPASAAGITRYDVEYAFDELGLPTGAVNGTWDEKTKRGICAWRELNGLPISRLMPTDEERALIVAQTQLPVPAKLKPGISINRQCQILYWVTINKTTGVKTLRGTFPVSTGQPGYDTVPGAFKIYREIPTWHESTLYEDAWMYRPKYFRGPAALHGSANDSLVKPYPASHGCVRMLHKHIDALWAAKVSIDTPVYIYGTWTDPIRYS
jgi:hypothetical protein